MDTSKRSQSEEWLHRINEMYRHPLLDKVEGMFIKIADLADGVAREISLPKSRVPIVFEKGIGINTDVCGCIESEHHGGSELFPHDPPLWTSNVRYTLLLVKPKRDIRAREGLPLQWGLWTLYYSRTKVGVIGCHTTVTESEIVSFDQGKVLEIFSESPHTARHFFDYLQLKINPYVASLRSDTKTLGDISTAAAEMSWQAQ